MQPPVHILIIDDEPMIRQIFAAILKQGGYATLEAENGRVGIELFRQHQVDLVLTDLDMPVVGGLEVLAHIHRYSPDTPVIIVSGAGQLDDAVQSIKLGAWDYLTKPIANMAMLENAIARCLEKVRLIRENRMYQQHLEEEVHRKTRELSLKNITLQEEVAERREREQDLRRINTQLEAVVDVSTRLFGCTTTRQLLQEVLHSMHRLLHNELGRGAEPGPPPSGDAFVMLSMSDETRLVCGEGSFRAMSGSDPRVVLPALLQDRVNRVMMRGESDYGASDFIGYIRTAGDARCVVYLDGCILSDETERRLLTIYMNTIASAIDSLILQEEIINTQKEVVITLGEVIETRSHETANHVRRVAEYTYLLARKWGLSEEESMLLRFASPMHDAGKIGIPDALLNKPGSLTRSEVEVMHGHTTLGFDLLKKSQRQILQMAAIVAHQHHERWDGRGYPRGLTADAIHLYGRIVALADVYDALGSQRCYKEAWPMAEVVALVKRERGGHFDPRLVDILIDNLPDFLAIREQYPDH
jgi:response regulator RpfG family c-di-GMP phosphodiesterase